MCIPPPKYEAPGKYAVIEGPNRTVWYQNASQLPGLTEEQRINFKRQENAPDASQVQPDAADAAAKAGDVFAVRKARSGSLSKAFGRFTTRNPMTKPLTAASVLGGP